MTEITPTTELEAVNAMLATIGEAPINTLNQPGLADATVAYNILQQVSRAVQSRGWAFNTEKEYPLAAAVDGTITIPTNTLQINVSPRMSSNLDLVWRGTKLYDRKNHTFTISQTVKCDIIWLFTFESIPETARWYITLRAARQFLDKTVGAADLHGFTEKDELLAETTMKESEAEAEDLNLITGNYDVYRSVDRFGVNWGNLIVQ